MKTIVTSGIVLSRTDYGEADRILTLITPDHGKVGILAKGVRKQGSKLAGGIELFSVSEVSFIRGRGELCTLTSARLKTYYQNIVKDVQRTLFAYEFLKMIHKVTEDDTGPEYFSFIEQVFIALNESKLSLAVVQTWTNMQLLQTTGHVPNLQSEKSGEKLSITNNYFFDLESMSFGAHANGQTTAAEIKFLRVCLGCTDPLRLLNVQGIDTVSEACYLLSKHMLKHFIR
jgi:DNA repair protein RecO (recombination protein O)